VTVGILCARRCWLHTGPRAVRALAPATTASGPPRSAAAARAPKAPRATSRRPRSTIPGCFSASASTRVPVTACEGTNTGFDGTSYLRDWPIGDPNLRRSPTIFATNDYGKNAQYGSLQTVKYTGVGGTIILHYNDFEEVLPNNRCPQR
jgi:hypothetical protein